MQLAIAVRSPVAPPRPLTFDRLLSLAEVAPSYLKLRSEHPAVPAKLVHLYLQEPGNDATFEEFVCRVTTGHRWSYSGTAYGGDDESYHGEGRCLCSHCGADGDA
jgi:hypothetical protein